MDGCLSNSIPIVYDSQRPYCRVDRWRGTVTPGRKHRNENPQLTATISNTAHPLLDDTLKTPGAEKITRKRTAQNHHTAGFTHAVHNRQTLSLLEQVHLYSRTCICGRASVIAREYSAVTPCNGKYSDEVLRRRAVFENTLLNITPT